MSTTFNYGEYLASREWAILKNRVRERAGGICERCRQSAIQATHHKTYERIGREQLDDLLGVCSPCHEYLSGKSDTDPATAAEPPARDWWVEKFHPPLKVYCAGKIGKNDWRHALFVGLSRAVKSHEVTEWKGWESSWFNHGEVRIDPSFVELPRLERDGLIYGGPYFISCDHGCFHGEGSHGQDGECGESGIRQSEISEACISLIEQADVVFCWLDSPDAYGSVFELGYASARRKPIFVATQTELPSAKDMWLLQQQADVRVVAQDAVAAWHMFIGALRAEALYPVRR